MEINTLKKLGVKRQLIQKKKMKVKKLISEDIQYKYDIRNIPQSQVTQKTLYSFLVSIGFQHIITPKVVIKNVDSDITINDIEENSKYLTITKMWRITSRKTGKPTPLIRIITHQKNTIDHLLIHGITLFGRTYYAEPSNPPIPTPVQCSRCFQFGNVLADCPNKPICPKCPNSHPPNTSPLGHKRGHPFVLLLPGKPSSVVLIMPQIQRAYSH
ncbi:hypothetical protein BDFB_011469 [Asbolus verrucosus]|uniref:Pre-C2HC domain-containing protein n=1 Tax=Asbolus verrucosus TaxID=1661398 RepID=A0A482V7Q1_ASBVE|nr:hypothetical protein BDFB_011469 [Asbolus verrucosus]